MSFQYQRLADQLAQQIYRGELAPHKKLNSLRDFARLHQISLTTAKSCYELLEAKGLIEVRAKSGYFVLQQQQSSVQPQHPDFDSKPRHISNLQLQNQIHDTSIQRQFVPLGAIQLGPNLIPVEGLRRSIQRALKHSVPQDFLYCHKQGHERLRQALVDHWREDGIYISSEEVFITNGCMPALAQIIQQLSQEGDSILLPTPTFNGQLQLLAQLKRKVIEVPASHEGIDLLRLEQFMQQGAAKLCLLTANFQNPLGYCLKIEDKQKIADLAAQYQCIVIEDDIYRECGYSSRQRPLPIRFWDRAGYVVWCGSVSKSLSSAYRMGWFCLGQQTQHLQPQFVAQNIGVNTPLQLGLADFIYSRAYQQHLDRLASQLMQQVEHYRAYILQAFEGVEIALSQPEGGYALWLQLPNQVDGLSLYKEALLQQISIVPGHVFGEDNRYQHFIRLNAGHALNDDIRQAIDFLAARVRHHISN